MAITHDAKGRGLLARLMAVVKVVATDVYRRNNLCCRTGISLLRTSGHVS